MRTKLALLAVLLAGHLVSCRVASDPSQDTEEYFGANVYPHVAAEEVFTPKEAIGPEQFASSEEGGHADYDFKCKGDACNHPNANKRWLWQAPNSTPHITVPGHKTHKKASKPSKPGKNQAPRNTFAPAEASTPDAEGSAFHGEEKHQPKQTHDPLANARKGSPAYHKAASIIRGVAKGAIPTSPKQWLNPPQGAARPVPLAGDIPLEEEKRKRDLHDLYGDDMDDDDDVVDDEWPWEYLEEMMKRDLSDVKEDAMDDADNEWPFEYWQGVEMGERPEAVKEALQKMVKEHAQAFAGSQQAKRDVEDYYEADVSDDEEDDDIQSQFGYGMIAVRAFG